MKRIFSLRFSERSESTQVVLKRCNVITTIKSHLKKWFLVVMGIVLASSSISPKSCIGAYLQDCNDNPVYSPRGYPVISNITLSGAPDGAKITSVDVRFKLEGWRLKAGLQYDNEYYIIYFPENPKSIYRGPYVEDEIKDITAFNNKNPNNKWFLHAASFPLDPVVRPPMTIKEWCIKVHYRNSYPPAIRVSPMSHDFGDIRVGGTSDPLEITISNTGEQDLHISDVALTDDTNFTLDVNGGSNPLGSTNPTLKEDRSGTVTVTFNPKVEDTFHENLKIFSNDPDSETVTISLNGEAEYPKTIYVDAQATGSSDGSSWSNAYRFLQDALDAALAGDQIRVAEGVYRPDTNIVNPNGTGDREATFQLVNSVAIKGGYAGFGKPNPDMRDFDEYETILSGDLNGNDVEVTEPRDLLNEPTRAENSTRVVTGSGTDASAVLDGFTITGACDCGMYNFNGNLTVTNCTFTLNAAGAGGGIWNEMGNPTMIDCSFVGNSVSDSGGGMGNREGSPILINCIFRGNFANGGGGMLNIYGGESTLTNCFFSENTAVANGGAIKCFEANSTLINCTFVANSATNGNALACDSVQQSHPSNVKLASCILWDGGSEIWNNDTSTITITYSDVQGGWTGMGNIDADPLFINPINSDYHLQPSSPCIDAGDNSAVPAGITTDLDGKPRFRDDPDTADTGNGTPPLVDMGAYEFQGISLITGDFCGDNSDQPDGYVDYWDLLYFAQRWHTHLGDPLWDPRCDLDKEDNYVDYWDLLVFAQNWHNGEPP